MKRNKRQRDDLSFTSRKLSIAGVSSVIFSAAALLLFPAAVRISFRAGGAAGMQVGAMGILALVFSLIGLLLGAAESRNDAINRSVPRLGARIGALALLLWIVIFIIGLNT